MASARKGLKIVFVSNNSMEAEETRCFLAGSGLNAFVLDSHLVSLNPVFGGPIGGVKVAVPEDQFERALRAMKTAGRGETGDSFHPYTDIMEDLSPENKAWVLGIGFGLLFVIGIAGFIISITRGG